MSLKIEEKEPRIEILGTKNFVLIVFYSPCYI